MNPNALYLDDKDSLEMTVSDVLPLTAEEKQYEIRLEQIGASTLGPKWRDCWPQHTEKYRPSGHISELGPFGSVERLIVRTGERVTGKDAACFVENITVPWAIRLGSAWNLDPAFFISHVRPLSDIEARQTLHECRVPNSKGGLGSSHGSSAWAIIRGYVDHGKPNRALATTDLADKTNRRHEESMYDTRQSHTNFSFYRVSESLRESGSTLFVHTRELTIPFH